MTKRLVDIDDQLLERARAASGEKTIRGTVEAGLRRLANDQLIRDHIVRLQASAFDLDALEQARAPRVPSEPDE